MWIERPLSEVATARGLVGGPFGSKLVSRDYTESGVPVIRGGNLDRGRFVDLSDAVYVSQDKFDRDLRGNAAEPGDLVFTQRGTLGQVAVMSSEAPTCVVSQSQMRLRVNTTIADAGFVYYWATSRQFLELLDDRAIVSGVPHINLGILGAMPIPLPPLAEQKRIAAVLGAFDDLIESNRALMTPLSEAAKAEGRRMVAAFVDRETVALTEYATITKGFSYKSAELMPGADTLVNLKNIGRGGVFQERGFKPLTSTRFKEAQIVVPGEVVVAMTDLTQQREVVARPVRIPDVQVEGRMVASLDLAVVRPKAGHAPEFIVGLLATDDFHAFARDYSNGTTVLHMSVRAFEDYRVPRIDPLEAAPFAGRIGVLNNASDSLASEIADLTRTRDELLPLLMSGRVRVAEAEEALASLTPQPREAS